MGNPSFGLYRGAEVQIEFGVLSLDDMRADTFINIRYDEQDFETIKGSDGSITRYATGNTLVHVDFTCKRSSKENAKLSALNNADLVTPGGAGVASFLCKDPNGSTLFAAAKAWLIGKPDSSFGKEVGDDVTWTIDCQIKPGTHIIGGNQL